MMENCCYDLNKTLYKASKLAWFLNKHAIPDSTSSKHEACKKCAANYKALLTDLEKHIDAIMQPLSQKNV